MNEPIDPQEQLEIQRLHHQIDDLTAALDAIRKGEVDALVQIGSGELRLYSRTTADRPYRLIVEEMGEGAATLSPLGRILFANQQLADLLQREHGTLLDAPLAELVTPECQEELQTLLGATPGHTRRAALDLKHADGGSVPVLASVSVIEIEREPVRCLIASDLTRIRDAEQALRASELSYRMLALNSLDGILMLDWESGRITRANPRICELLARNATELIGQQLWEINAFKDHQRAQALFLELKANGSVRYDDLMLLDSSGALKKVDFIGNAYPVGEKQVIQCSIRDISVRRDIEQLEQQRQTDLLRSFQGMVSALVTLSEARDPYACGHQSRVAHLAAAIGDELGLNADEVEGLRISGLVHDIGKVLIPSEILTKPSALTPEELALVRTHVQQGYDVLSPIPFPWPVAEAVLHHHERLDGSGYPQGLEGEAISRGGRILAVADTVEAMATDRPYRASAGIEAALATIQAGRDRLFDPAVVDACLRLFQERSYALISAGTAIQA